MIDSLAAPTGYTGLFAVSFLAATIIPLGSEAAVALLALQGFNPGAVFLTAAVGNSLGAFVNYYVGHWGSRRLLARRIRPDSETLAQARKTFGRWGSPVLFFAWAPVIGDPLTVAAGVLRVRLSVFAFWVVLGKSLRYALILKGLELSMA